MLSHKIILNKPKKIKIISSILYDHSDMKLENDYKKKTGKSQIYGD